MKVEFTIEGEPVSKGRPRFSKGKVYTPDKTVMYEELIGFSYISKNKGKMLQGPLRATIYAYLQIPKSATAGKRLAMQKNIVRPTKTPDCDNLAKSILDGLNKIAYKDDSQVVDLVLQKFWSQEPRVEVTLEEIKLEG